jgi:tetratricopeptide (TPR) repeat protein
MSSQTPAALAEAIAAARAGERARAREILGRLLRGDSANPEYWIWLSAVTDTDRERIYCLESALRLDPTNRAAIRGLALLGARTPKPAEIAAAVRVPRRKAASAAARASGIQAIPRTWILAGGAVVGLLVVGTAVLAVLSIVLPRLLPGPNPTLPPETPTPTATPVNLTPTITPTPIPVETRIYRTPVPPEATATPLLYLVPMTPTPSPFYGLAQHPYEAYSSGVRAFLSGQYPESISLFDQVLAIDPSLADVQYLRGEAFRLLGDYPNAIGAYDQAVQLNEAFAPAYLGRGRAILANRLRQNPNLGAEGLPNDFALAIERDPFLADAYLDPASFYASRRIWLKAEETLLQALSTGLTTPLIYIRLSEAQINLLKYEEALRNAIEGSANDPTLLEGYFAVGRAYVEADMHASGLWPLMTYTLYRSDDPDGWAYLGIAQFAAGDPQAAFDSAMRALTIDERNSLAYTVLGLVYLAWGENQAAIDNLLRASQFGVVGYDGLFALGRAYYGTGDFANSLDYLNAAIEKANAEEPELRPREKMIADAYVYRALIYEANPDLLNDAILNWTWILELEGSSPEARAMAEQHLAVLTGMATAAALTETPIPTVVVATPGPETPTATSSIPTPRVTPRPTPFGQ